MNGVARWLAEATHCPCAGLMLAKRLRRWSSIKPALGALLAGFAMPGCWGGGAFQQTAYRIHTRPGPEDAGVILKAISITGYLIHQCAPSPQGTRGASALRWLTI